MDSSKRCPVSICCRGLFNMFIILTCSVISNIKMTGLNVLCDILWKESLNNDGQQFYQYQQNEQSPLTLNHWT